jgi:hypothetical protein
MPSVLLTITLHDCMLASVGSSAIAWGVIGLFRQKAVNAARVGRPRSIKMIATVTTRAGIHPPLCVH